MKIEINRTVILLVVLHGYETGSVILREEHSLTLFKNWVVRKYLGLRGRRGRRPEKITYWVA
jgi:hypothetical protein